MDDKTEKKLDEVVELIKKHWVIGADADADADADVDADVDAEQSENDEPTANKEEEPVDYSGVYKDQNELDQERQAIEKAVRNKQISPSRARLQLWLYRAMRIVITDGRILIGVFLCTDSKANIILGVCTEYTRNDGGERMIGLVMVPGSCKQFSTDRR